MKSSKFYSLFYNSDEVFPADLQNASYPQLRAFKSKSGLHADIVEMEYRRRERVYPSL